MLWNLFKAIFKLFSKSVVAPLTAANEIAACICEIKIVGGLMVYRKCRKPTALP